MPDARIDVSEVILPSRGMGETACGVSTMSCSAASEETSSSDANTWMSGSR